MRALFLALLLTGCAVQPKPNVYEGHVTPPHRQANEVRAFEQGKTNITCPGQHVMTIDLDDGVVVFLECFN